jgi:hypothetical protein
MSPRNASGFCVVFGIVCSLVYALAVYKNYALFTYHPAIGEFGWGAEKAREGGPAMYWYGWIATSVISGTVAGFIASLMPARITDRLWPALTWLAPLCAMLFFGYILRNYFLH